MGLQSNLFRGDPKLEACLVSDPAHVMLGASGPHVGKIQFALTVLGAGTISADEISAERYGPSTANAVLGYKTARRIINFKYQRAPDNIVGKMTMASLDAEMVKFEKTRPAPPVPPSPPDPQPVPPPTPVEKPGRRFAIRGALGRGGIFLEEPFNGDPTTVSSEIAANCFQVFDIDNMPVVQLDAQHMAVYFFEAAGVFPVMVPSTRFKRLPRMFTLLNPLPLNGLGCRCTYRTIAHNDGRRESFLDLRIGSQVVSVPMFIHFIAQPHGSLPFVEVSQHGVFRFVRRAIE